MLSAQSVKPVAQRINITQRQESVSGDKGEGAEATLKQHAVSYAEESIQPSAVNFFKQLQS